MLCLLGGSGKCWILPGPFELKKFSHEPWILDRHGHDIAWEQGAPGQRYGKHLHTTTAKAHALCYVQ